MYAGQALLPVVSEQAARCMDCGIPFCHNGCPLGNLIPEWNVYAARGDWAAAAERLHATNNFPEFTGRLCPAPCEDACVLAINADPVTIKNVEQAIADQIWERGTPRRSRRSGSARRASPSSAPGRPVSPRRSSSPAAATPSPSTSAPTASADCCATASPRSRWRSASWTAGIGQMRAEGTTFRTGVDVGGDLDAAELARRHDAVVIAVGARGAAGARPSPAASLSGIHQAMEYLTLANRVTEGDCDEPRRHAEGRHVVIIGGGDTGSDCLGTVLRQGAASVVQLDINPEPDDDPADDEPWPTYPKVYRISHAHEEARGRAGTDPQGLLRRHPPLRGDRDRPGARPAPDGSGTRGAGGPGRAPSG